MGRTYTIVFWLSPVILVGFIAWGIVHDPVQSEQAWLSTELQQVSAEGAPDQETEVNFGRFEDAVRERPDLWQPLVSPPRRAAAPPNLEKMLRGVVPTRQQIGSGRSMKVLIKLPKNAAGEWKMIGDEINGVKIKEITRTGVIFSLVDHGKEYVTTLPR